jgi:hypothetical protein
MQGYGQPQPMGYGQPGYEQPRYGQSGCGQPVSYGGQITYETIQQQSFVPAAATGYILTNQNVFWHSIYIDIPWMTVYRAAFNDISFDVQDTHFDKSYLFSDTQAKNFWNPK